MFCKLLSQEPEKALLDLVTRQLEKADPNATANDLRRYGTLGVLRQPSEGERHRKKACLSASRAIAGSRGYANAASNAQVSINDADE